MLKGNKIQNENKPWGRAIKENKLLATRKLFFSFYTDRGQLYS